MYKTMSPTHPITNIHRLRNEIFWKMKYCAVAKQRKTNLEP